MGLLWQGISVKNGGLSPLLRYIWDTCERNTRWSAIRGPMMAGVPIDESLTGDSTAT
jgi:hypothetical protein